ncbi:MAG: NAD(P)H-dependent oxidoreductase subunit E, partial [Anaerolineales bacterium]|nr:NAD(P)H-dependent oxidoreductase subunit E [Anaerolineales bacterium]
MTTSVDLTLLEPLLAQYNGRSRDALLPFLHDAQALYGWLPRPVQEAISRTLRVPLADIHGVVEFYTMFYNEPTAKRVIRVCDDMACRLAGSAYFIEALETRLGLQSGQTSPNGSVTYERVPCLGMCEHGPNALRNDEPAGHLTPDDVNNFLVGAHPEPRIQKYGGPLLKLARAGKVIPWSLNDYEQHGGYATLRKALAQTPEEIITTLEASKILGRGGAMFPTGLKWRYTRSAPGTPAQKHLIANADESEPGTFKDRGLLEEDPFSLVEAMTIAAYAIGVENGWIFIRGEYPRGYRRLVTAVNLA